MSERLGFEPNDRHVGGTCCMTLSSLNSCYAQASSALVTSNEVLCGHASVTNL